VALALGLLLSMLIHALLVLGIGTEARRTARELQPTGTLSVRLMAALTAPPSLTVPARSTMPEANPDSRRSAPPAPTRDTHTDVLPDTARPGVADNSPMALIGFDPNTYLRPSDVAETAKPVSPETLDLLRLTGDQPGLWTMRMFIDENGSVDEIEVVEARGAEPNTRELSALLRSIRFTPALAQGRPVKSQKMLEFSFEPGPEPLLAVPVPSPSATGK
jgi:hypothetical protein